MNLIKIIIINIIIIKLINCEDNVDENIQTVSKTDQEVVREMSRTEEEKKNKTTSTQVESNKSDTIMNIIIKGSKGAKLLEHSVKKDLSAKRHGKRSAKDNNTTNDVKPNNPRSKKPIPQMKTTDTADFDDEDEEELLSVDDIEEDIEDANVTELGMFLGAPCEFTCSAKLLHVFCDPGTQTCACEKKYPVPIGANKGCAKPKQLGDQCFYAQTCSYFDPNSACTQINHNAVCQCKPGYHTVDIQKGVKRMFCSEDLVVLTTDLPTLLGVATGLAILSGLICFVLKLFSGRRNSGARHYGDANLPPHLLFSGDNQWINGIPLTVHNRPSSRSSSRRSTSNLTHGYSTRSKGVFVPASRAGSRRPSLSSVQSTASSQRSYSTRRFEQEREQKEQRAAIRVAREEAARQPAAPTPSPMSTDELLGIFNKNEIEDPVGFSSSVLSVKSAASQREDGSVTPVETLTVLRH